MQQPHSCGQGLAGAPQHDAKQRHSCWAAGSSPEGPGSQQTWGNDEKSHPPRAASCGNHKKPGPHVQGCLTHCHREGKSQAIHFLCFIAMGYSSSSNFKGRCFPSL